MLYSLTILLFGIYLGQELNLPNIKKLTLSVTTLYKEQPIETIESNIKTNYFTRFIDYILNKQKLQN